MKLPHLAPGPGHAAPASSLSPAQAERERAKARWLWHCRQPIAGTAAEVYVRKAIGYDGMIPATIGFLPERDGYEPVLIAALGMTAEPEPRVLAIGDDAVVAVQVIKLCADGSGMANVAPNKIIVGRGALGSPIVIAPSNDGLGIAITNTIEDALSIHEETGLGALCGGGAIRLPSLASAVPDYVGCVTIIADRNPDTLTLFSRLRQRGIETVLDARASR